VNSELLDLYDDPGPSPSRFPKGVPNALLAVLLLAILGSGWALRDDIALVPEEGVGYWMGVSGTGMLLVYLPLALFQRPNAPGFWFHVTGLLGLLAPVMILFHANFHWGMPATAVALVTVLVSAVSTGFGRVLGRRLAALYEAPVGATGNFQAAFEEAAAELEAALAISPALLNHLHQFESQESSRSAGLWSGFRNLRGLRARKDAIQQRSMKFLRDVLESQAAGEDWSSEQLKRRLATVGGRIDAFLKTLANWLEFRVCRRLFALWRLLHLVLALVLLAAIGAHVWVVHAY